MTQKFDLVYKTTTTPFFPICLIGQSYSGDFSWLGVKKLKKIPVIAVIRDGAVNWFFDQQLKQSAIKIFKNIYHTPQCLNKIKNKEREISNILLREIKTPIQSLFDDKKLNQPGINKLKKIFSHYAEYGHYVDDPGFLFQLYLVDEFKKAVYQNVPGDMEEKNKVFSLLLSSNQLTHYERFLMELRQLIILKEKPVPRMKKISKKFFWLVHDYLGDIIDAKYLFRKIKEIDKNPRELTSQCQAAVKRVQDIKAIEKCLPQKLLRQVKTIQPILYLYNERKKEVLNQVNIFLKNLFHYKFGHMSFGQLHTYYQLTPDGIIDALCGLEIKKYGNREKSWVYYIANEKIKNGPKKFMQLVEVQGNATTLRGACACPGRIKGRVNIILNISHIFKFKKGDILVAPFTNVNYLPIMNRAAAILTETGGLTSHAAIVARELKKPCVVGIKNLTATLKDGDLVEVDADKGVAKIVK